MNSWRFILRLLSSWLGHGRMILGIYIAFNLGCNFSFIKARESFVLMMAHATCPQVSSGIGTMTQASIPSILKSTFSIVSGQMFSPQLINMLSRRPLMLKPWGDSSPKSPVCKKPFGSVMGFI